MRRRDWDVGGLALLGALGTAAPAWAKDDGVRWPAGKANEVSELRIGLSAQGALRGLVIPGSELPLAGRLWVTCARPDAPAASTCDERWIQAEKGGALHWRSRSVSVVVEGGTFDPESGVVTVDSRPSVSELTVRVHLDRGGGLDPLSVTLRAGFDWEAVRGPDPEHVAAVEVVSDMPADAWVVPGRDIPVHLRVTDLAGRVFEGHRVPFGLPDDRYAVRTSSATFDPVAQVLHTERERATNRDETFSVTFQVGGDGEPSRQASRRWRADFAWLLGPDPADVVSFTPRWEWSGVVVAAPDGTALSVPPGAETQALARVVARDGRIFDAAVPAETEVEGVIGLPRERLAIRAAHGTVDPATFGVRVSSDIPRLMGQTLAVDLGYVGRPDLRATLRATPDFRTLLIGYALSDATRSATGAAGGAGAEGSVGPSGPPGSNGPSRGGTGGDGGEGGAGSPGKAGPSLDVWATRVTLIGTDEPWILLKWKVAGGAPSFAVRQESTGALTFASIGGPGGDGGPGGAGGTGGSGGFNYDYCAGADGGSGGRGGVGGTGGVGGPGGRVTLRVSDEALSAVILALSQGGAGGDGGPGGDGGRGGKSGGAANSGAAMAKAAAGLVAAAQGKYAPNCANLGDSGPRGSEGPVGATGEAGRDGAVDLQVLPLGRAAFADAPPTLLQLVQFGP